MPCYVALLRGINVGGNRLVPMAALRRCVEDLGHQNVTTYIQSGNVLLRSRGRSADRLRASLETALATRFGFPIETVVLHRGDYRSALARAHPGWGAEGDGQKHDAMFTIGETTADEVLAALPPPVRGLETVSVGPGVLFWSASKEGLAQTTKMTLGKHPLYKRLTVRNHRTTRKLRDLLDAMG